MKTVMDQPQMKTLSLEKLKLVDKIEFENRKWKTKENKSIIKKENLKTNNNN